MHNWITLFNKYNTNFESFYLNKGDKLILSNNRNKLYTYFIIDGLIILSKLYSNKVRVIRFSYCDKLAIFAIFL